MLPTRKSFGSSLGVSKATWDTICKETLTVRAEFKKKGQHLKWTVMQSERSQHASQFSDAFDKCVGYLAKHHLKQNNMKTGAVTDLFYPNFRDMEMLTHMYETTSKLPTEVYYVCTVVHQSSFPSVQWKRLCAVRTRTCSLRSDRAELLKHVKGLKNTCLSHVQKKNSNEWKMLTSLSNLTSCFFFTVSSRKHV